MKNEGPLVTVVVPCFNQSQFLKRSLSSLLNQGIPREQLEIIVIDDGSESPVEASQLKDLASAPIKLVRTANQGLSAARNKGLELATGNFIQFLDADDYLLPNKLSSQLEIFDKNLDTDIVVCDYWIENHWAGNWIKSTGTSTRLKDPAMDFRFRWETEISIPIHCALFRRACIGANRFRENLRAKEDWIFWLTLCLNKINFKFQDQQMAVYVLHHQNMTKQSDQILKSFLRAAKIVHDEFCLSSDEKVRFFDFVTDVLNKGYLPRLRNECSREIQLGSALLARWANFRNGLSSLKRKKLKRAAYVSSIALLLILVFTWIVF